MEANPVPVAIEHVLAKEVARQSIANECQPGGRRCSVRGQCMLLADRRAAGVRGENRRRCVAASLIALVALAVPAVVPHIVAAAGASPANNPDPQTARVARFAFLHRVGSPLLLHTGIRGGSRDQTERSETKDSNTMYVTYCFLLRRIAYRHRHFVPVQPYEAPSLSLWRD